MRNIFILFIAAFVVAAFALGDTMLKYEVLDEYDTSHWAANRITVYVKLQSDCTKRQVLEIIDDASSKYIPNYDIIWLEIVPKDATKAPEGWRGWRPIICKTKWISKSLDEKWHTTSDGFEASENYESIGVSWSEWFEREQSSPPTPKETIISSPKEKVSSPVKQSQKKKNNKQTFDPTTVMRQLQSPELFTDIPELEWKRSNLYDGTERWLGEAEDMVFEITPSHLYVFAITVEITQSLDALMAMAELNRIAFPLKYEKVNHEYLPGLIESAALYPDQKHAKTFFGYHLTCKQETVLSGISYKISKD